jgi:hypothetical protein
MKRMFRLMVAVMFVVACVPTVWGGEAIERIARNVNISSENWNGVADSVLLKVEGINADSRTSARFGVVACDRLGNDDTASISLMRTGTTLDEIATSSNDSEAGQSRGNRALTIPRLLAEGDSETLFAVLTAPQLNGDTGLIDAGWQIGSEGFRKLEITILATFFADATDPVVTIGGPAKGCGVNLFP